MPNNKRKHTWPDDSPRREKRREYSVDCWRGFPSTEVEDAERILAKLPDWAHVDDVFQLLATNFSLRRQGRRQLTNWLHKIPEELSGSMWFRSLKGCLLSRGGGLGEVSDPLIKAWAYYWEDSHQEAIQCVGRRHSFEANVIKTLSVYHQKRPEACVDLAEELRQRFPESLEALCLKQMSLDGDWFEPFLESQERYGKRLFWLTTLVEEYEKSASYEEGFRYAKLLLTLYDESFQGLRYMMNYSYYRQQYGIAMKYARRLHMVYPDYPEVFCRKAEILHKQDRVYLSLAYQHLHNLKFPDRKELDLGQFPDREDSVDAYCYRYCEKNPEIFTDLLKKNAKFMEDSKEQVHVERQSHHFSRVAGIVPKLSELAARLIVDNPKPALSNLALKRACRPLIGPTEVNAVIGHNGVTKEKVAAVCELDSLDITASDLSFSLWSAK